MSFDLKQQLQRHLVIGRWSPVVDSDLQPLEIHVCDISLCRCPTKSSQLLRQTVADLCSVVHGASVKKYSEKEPGLPAAVQVSEKQ